jgi:hypothetical protein
MKEEGRSAGCFKGRTRFFQTRTMHSYVHMALETNSGDAC